MKLLLTRLGVIYGLSLGLVWALFPYDLNPGGLKLAMKGLGGGLSLLSMFLGAGLYRRKHTGGIVLASRAKTLLLDSILLVVAAGSWIMITDYLLVSLWDVPELINDAALLYVSSLMILILGLPLCALYVSSLAAGSVIVDAGGVLLHGLFGTSSLEWSQLRDIQVGDIRVPSANAGIYHKKTATKTLDLEGQNESLSILAPAAKADKQRILIKLQEHAPEEWQQKITKAGQDW